MPKVRGIDIDNDNDKNMKEEVFEGGDFQSLEQQEEIRAENQFETFHEEGSFSSSDR